MTTPVIFPSVGFLGLNKASSQNILGPEWAVEAQNIVVDSAGRFAARKGWVNQTSAAMSGTPNVEALHEFTKDDGTTSLVAGAGNKLWESLNSGGTWSDVTGTLTPTSSKWQFANLNSRLYGAQVGHPLITKTMGNFSALTAVAGSVPASPVALLAAYGRLWALESDLQTIKYSALLDPTRWDVASGGGTIDLRKVWTQGTDTGVAIRAFSGRLVVFGKKHIILWVDGHGSALGLNPTDIYVEDVIEGIGATARDGIQNIGEGDLVFLGQNGVQSLARVLQEQQTPVSDITKNSRQYFNTRIQNTAVDQTEIRSVYSPEEGFYLLTVPDALLTICVDLRMQLQDGTYRIFEWPSFIPRAMCRTTNGNVLFGFAGVVGRYGHYSDNGTGYWYVLRTAFLDLQDENVLFKELKRIKVVANAGAGLEVDVKWWWDFAPDYFLETLTYASGDVSEYGVSEYAIGEYGGAVGQRTDVVPAGGSGQFFQLGVETLIDGTPFALQLIQAYYETGRLA